MAWASVLGLPAKAAAKALVSRLAIAVVVPVIKSATDLSVAAFILALSESSTVKASRLGKLNGILDRAVAWVAANFSVRLSRSNKKACKVAVVETLAEVLLPTTGSILSSKIRKVAPS